MQAFGLVFTFFFVGVAIGVAISVPVASMVMIKRQARAALTGLD